MQFAKCLPSIEGTPFEDLTKALDEFYHGHCGDVAFDDEDILSLIDELRVGNPEEAFAVVRWFAGYLSRHNNELLQALKAAAHKLSGMGSIFEPEDLGAAKGSETSRQEV